MLFHANFENYLILIDSFYLIFDCILAAQTVIIVRSFQKTSRISRRMSPSHLLVLKKITLLLYRHLLIRLRHSVL